MPLDDLAGRGVNEFRAVAGLRCGFQKSSVLRQVRSS
jgi:hypothetical protein